MRRGSIEAAASFGLLALGLATGTARAVGPVDVEVAAKGGFATNPIASNPSAGGLSDYLYCNVSLNPNRLGPLVGGRAGVSYLGVYGGVQMTYYFGGSATGTDSCGHESESRSAHTITYGIEGGYGFKLLELVTIRPLLGIGNATFFDSRMISSPNANAVGGTSTSDLYFEPGVLALFSIHGWLIGIDASLLFVPGYKIAYGGNWTTSFAVDGQAGVKF